MCIRSESRIYGPSARQRLSLGAKPAPFMSGYRQTTPATDAAITATSLNARLHAKNEDAFCVVVVAAGKGVVVIVVVAISSFPLTQLAINSWDVYGSFDGSFG